MADNGLFYLPPGVDFAAQVAQGLRQRFGSADPLAMARVQVIVNTARMQARLRQALIDHGPGFLPRIRLIADLAPPGSDGLPTLLTLAQAIRQFLRAQPDMGPPSTAFSLGQSLFALLDEMQGEGVALSALERLDVTQHSQHWDRSLRLIRLIAQHLETHDGGQARLRDAVLGLIDGWRQHPPRDPIVIAGSTGSRGPSALLMQAVARLPQGAVILPGFDTHMPEQLWSSLPDSTPFEDHPQFRLIALVRALAPDLAAPRPWTTAKPPADNRNAAVSLALRPVPVTDQWLRDGPKLGDLLPVTQDLSLIEAPDQRIEALAIALAMRDGVARGLSTALVTPDRTLARRVTLALNRWGIRPDDSAGRPLSLTAAGRFVRQVAQALVQPLGSQELVSLLKHPLAFSTDQRGPHLLTTRALDLFLRARVAPQPSPAVLAQFGARDASLLPWVEGLGAWLDGLHMPAEAPLGRWLDQLITQAQNLASGFQPQIDSRLWAEPAGEAVWRLLEGLGAAAEAGGALSGQDFLALLDTVFSGQELRESVEADKRFAIWGTLEVRAQTADLVICGGLNEGIWPASPQPDPWFNRQMRRDSGLLLPERQIGLSAHDFQQAVAARHVVLSRALRQSDAPSIASRWVNRLTNLIAGLPAQNGPLALKEMQARGRVWNDRALALEADTSGLPAALAERNPRPAPAPGRHQRLKTLRVTQVETLIRDPYSIYARQILALKELEVLEWGDDPRLRGTIVHEIADRYVHAHPPGSPGDVSQLMMIADDTLEKLCPWQSLRLIWRAQLQKCAADFVAWNARLPTRPVLVEKGGVWDLPPGLSLSGRPDRIDGDETGGLHIYDYKTGAPPAKKQQDLFNKQLPLLALMAEQGAFPGLEPAEVVETGYVQIGNSFDVTTYAMDRDDLAKHHRDLMSLIDSYADPDQGFTAMRALESDRRRAITAYQTLARLGEWEPTDPAQTQKVGQHDE